MFIKSAETGSNNYTGTGQLTFNVFDRDIGMPVPDARIKVFSQESERKIPVEELITDSSGATLSLELPCPDKEYSLSPQNNVRPYSEYNIEVSAAGFAPVYIEGAEILAGTTALQEITLSPLESLTRQEKIIRIPEHTLWGEYPPKVPEDEVKSLGPSTGFVVLDEPVIPEYIVVHAGHPDDTSAQNYYVRYKDYIKNVASCEIYATWPAQTIRANVLCIMSFTLNRVFTEWYRNRGKNFTITNSTAFDQAFVYGRNIYDEISAIVDEIFVNYITRPGIRQPLFAQYCDGRNVTCPSWLSQWGSKDLGDKGYDTMAILKNYYGYDVYLDQAAQVAGVPSSFPGTPLSSGSTGPAVRTIQTQLNAISNNYPLIPKIRVDGVYGNNTRNAVEIFQSIFKMPETGIVDSATWYRISDIYVAVSKLSELV